MKTTIKKTLSIVLAILMIVSAIPTMAFASDENIITDFTDAKVLSEKDGYLYIDGVKVSENSSGTTQHLPTGKYKLGGNASLSSCSIWIDAGEQVEIDLNGYEWSFKGDNHLTLVGELSLYDLSENETGKIVAETGWGTVNEQGDNAVLNLYGGTLESTVTNGYAVRAVSSYGQVNLYGGTLKGAGYAMRYSTQKSLVKIVDTVFESGEGYAQIRGAINNGATPTKVIDVSDYTGNSLTVDFYVSVAGKHTVFSGVKSKEEADKYTINVTDEYSKTLLDKIEYDEATGEIYAYVVANAFTQQPTEENNFTVDFNHPEATFKWYGFEEVVLTPDNVAAIEGAPFEDGKWICDGTDYSFFSVNVQAGTTITASANNDFEYLLEVFSDDFSVYKSIPFTGTGSVTVDTDAEVYVAIYNYVYDGTPVGFEFKLTRTSALDSETGESLQNPECEKSYLCMATVGENTYYSDVVTVEHNIIIDKAVDPTCTETGLKEGSHCTKCDNMTVVQETVPALDHDWSNKDGFCETCNEPCPHESCTDGVCDICEYECLHENYIDGVCDVCKYECPHESYTDGKCDNCGTARAHVDNDMNGICDDCGKYYGTAGEGVTWVLDAEGTLTISGEGAIVVDYYAPPWAEYNDLIKAVVIEEGVTAIGDTAFCYAEKLVTVSIPSTVKTIGDLVFSYCSALEEINVAEANTAYKDIDGVLFTEDEKTLVAYPANRACEEYTIPAATTTIGYCAFRVCAAVEKVIIPDTVTVIEDSAFQKADIKEIEIGNGVEIIPSNCFNAANIETVIIPDSVKTIEEYAFWVFNGKTIVLGSGIETIGKSALAYTDNLTAVHYKGTQEDWDKIAIDENNTDANGLLTKEIHFVEEKEAADPDCTTDGHTAGLYCAECEEYMTGEAVPKLGHKIVDGLCETCNEPCAHESYTDGVCDACEYECSHESYTDGVCDVCKYECPHESYTDGVCDVCKYECPHESYTEGVCDDCGKPCTHVDNDINEICDNCGEPVPLPVVKLDVWNTVYIDENRNYVLVKFIPEESGSYAVVSDNCGSGDPCTKVYNEEFALIAEHDDINYDEDILNFYCVFNAEAGKTYYILLNNYDGNVTYDYLVKRNEVITHQPTADEPYVELSDDTDAKYQWHYVEKQEIEFTEENSSGIQAGSNVSSYDAEKGWIGAHAGTYEFGEYYGYVYLELEAGDTITVVLTGDACEAVYLLDYVNGNTVAEELPINDANIYKFTIENSSYYIITTYKDPNGEPVYLRVYGVRDSYVPIEGATEARYDATEDGIYACQVTYADGRKEMSQSFEVDIPGFTGIKDNHFYIDDVMQKAYQLVEFEGEFYYIGDRHEIIRGREAYLTEERINGLTYADGTEIEAGWYEFDADGKMVIRNGLVGNKIYKDNVLLKAYQLVEIDGEFYYIGDRHEIIRGREAYVTAERINGLTYADGTEIEAGWYEFDADGKMVIRNGLVGNKIYKDNVLLKAYQLVEIDGEFYYIGDRHEIVKGKRVYLREDRINGLTYADGTPITAGYYEFDENGKMVILNGVVGNHIYKDNTMLKAYQLVEVDGYIYYIGDRHEIIRDKKAYVSEERLNGVTFADGTPVEAGWHSFDENGKLYIIE